MIITTYRIKADLSEGIIRQNETDEPITEEFHEELQRLAKKWFGPSAVAEEDPTYRGVSNSIRGGNIELGGIQ